jgi:hypothetical protein
MIKARMVEVNIKAARNIEKSRTNGKMKYRDK